MHNNNHSSRRHNSQIPHINPHTNPNSMIGIIHHNQHSIGTHHINTNQYFPPYYTPNYSYGAHVATGHNSYNLHRSEELRNMMPPKPNIIYNDCILSQKQYNCHHKY